MTLNLLLLTVALVGCGDEAELRHPMSDEVLNGLYHLAEVDGLRTVTPLHAQDLVSVLQTETGDRRWRAFAVLSEARLAIPDAVVGEYLRSGDPVQRAVAAGSLVRRFGEDRRDEVFAFLAQEGSEETRLRVLVSMLRLANYRKDPRILDALLATIGPHEGRPMFAAYKLAELVPDLAPSGDGIVIDGLPDWWRRVLGETRQSLVWEDSLGVYRVEK